MSETEITTTSNNADPAVVSSATTDSRRLLRPKSVPLLHPYRSGAFLYVRDCFDEYYQLVEQRIMNQQRTPRIVTVTGTSGVGTSVFYAYFVDRFQKTHPDVWLVATAYCNKHVFRMSVFNTGIDDTTSEALRDKEQAMYTTVRRAKTLGKKVLYLCDGEPSMIYSGATSVVFVSSEHSQWLRTSKKHDAWPLFLPMWTREELQDASVVLGHAASLTDDVVNARFAKYGGVAYDCLALLPDIIEQADDEVATALSWMVTPDHLCESLRGGGTSMASMDTRRRLFHEEPRHGIDSGATRLTRSLASTFVRQTLTERFLVSSNYEDRQQLRMLAQNTPMSEWVFQLDTHDTLRRGCTLQLRLLLVNPSGNSSSTMTTEISLAPSKRPLEERSIYDLSPHEVLARGPYHVVDTTALGASSIDAYYDLPPTTTHQPAAEDHTRSSCGR